MNNTSNVKDSTLICLRKILINDEGLRFQPYKDTLGFWTIGVGHYIGYNLTQLRLTKNVVDAILKEDIEIHYRILQDIFGDEFLESIEEARVAGLFSLAFTMGENFKSWTSSIALVKSKRWGEFADIVKRSKWASDVDPLKREEFGRDNRVVFMLREGKFHEEYKLG